MIIGVFGMIGSTKTSGAVRKIVRNPHSYFYTNFDVKTKNVHRLKKADLVKAFDKDGKELKYPLFSEKGIKFMANWDFLEDIGKKHKYYSLMIDEIGNIFMSRRSMSGFSIEGIRIISQMRKILSDNPNNHAYLLTQHIDRLDKAWRELLQRIIYCRKEIVKGKVYSHQMMFDSDDLYTAEVKYLNYLENPADDSMISSEFMVNVEPYFRFYNTLQIVRESEWL